ncbi:uncharacterized protein LOC127639582 isoform X7 [Xyrauchen texanus]|uniref:uncharacterized protein LOC127639582 isoform X6 n=1 Tax=Xyrauchen texanus TaxID=154827 RepID=UPI00224255D4|nr:uncharacterized protein LOC127639582 isoform X6 [Xyrauchen texanus]XP_051977634.1 uncharacterized protein LOC127639582 isoform X7 [Xyrauchen texanus]
MIAKSCFLWLWLAFGVFGVDTDGLESVSVMEGDSVTLHTDVTDIQSNDQIVWVFSIKNSDTRIAEIYKHDINMHESNEIFGDKLQLDDQTGSLTIRNIRIKHSGLYKLTIFRSKGISYKTFSVTVYSHLPIPIIIISDSSQKPSSRKSSSSSKCVLLCSVVNVTHVTLSWYKGNSLLSSISVSDLNSLSLPLEVEYQENNTYSCVINNPIRNQTKHLDINEVCQPGSERREHSTIILVISLSLLILITAAAVGGIYLCQKKNTRPV